MPKISVIMPVYNGEKYLEEAIDSILNQTFDDFEFIIVNDGSEDGSENIIQSYPDPRIIYLKNNGNKGIVYSLNRGLDVATGTYIARMDADDISENDRFEKQLAVMEKDLSIGVLGTGTQIFGDVKEPYNTASSTNPDKLKAELLFAPCLCHPTAMIRRDTLEQYHIRYKEEFRGAEDYELWWQIASVSKIVTISDALHRYRIHLQQVTQVRDENYIALLQKMLDLRMQTLGIELSDNEQRGMMTYCLGDYAMFERTTVYDFIHALERIMCGNKKVKFFEQRYLREVMGLAVEYAINNSQMSMTDKKDCRKYAIQKKIYPAILRLKIFAHKVIGE